MNANAPFPRHERDRPRPVRPERVHLQLPAHRKRADAEFLPAALEILETPPSPVAVALIWVFCILATTTLIWAYFGRIDVIAIAQGKIQPTGRVKIIQPLEAGRVVDLHVENGQKVRAGDNLAILDSGEADAEVADLTAGFNAYRAEAVRRHVAEDAVIAHDVTAVPKITWDSEMPDEVRLREDRVLTADLAQVHADVANLQAQKVQKQNERDRYAATAAALNDLIATLQDRVDMRISLSATGAGSRVDLINAQETLQTQKAALATARGQITEAQGSMDVLDRSIDASYRTFSAQNLQKLAEAERQADDYRHRLAKALVKQHQLVLKSPIDGTVSALAITTIGQVVSAGEEIMRIVPDGQGLEIEAYLLNRDVGFVHVGQEAIVKIESLPFTRYGTINATLTKIADDAIPEPEATQAEGNPARPQTDRGFAGAERTQNLVFATTLVPQTTSLMADGVKVPLSPGMAVTVEIKTGSRRILEYVFSPLVEVASRAMKER